MFRAITENKYQGFNDIDLQKAMLKEMWRNDVSLIPWYFLNKSEQMIWDDPEDKRPQWDCQLTIWDLPFKCDDLYGEDLHKIFSCPIEVHFWIVSELEDQSLSKFAIDEQREIQQGRLLIPLLEEEGLDRWIGIGDKFVYDGHEYEVLTVKRDNYWVNTEIPLELLITAERYRQGDRTDDPPC